MAKSIEREDREERTCPLYDLVNLRNHRDASEGNLQEGFRISSYQNKKQSRLGGFAVDEITDTLARADTS